MCNAEVDLRADILGSVSALPPGPDAWLLHPNGEWSSMNLVLMLQTASTLGALSLYLHLYGLLEQIWLLSDHLLCRQAELS